jgi:hypothetical protein
MNGYGLLADLVAAVHLAYVGFVVVAMLLIVVGLVLRWQWVRNFYFRLVHFVMIAVVVAESLCGVTCPLTDWERELRIAANQPWDEGSFVGRLVHDVMFFEAEPWVFTVCYCLFGLAVLVTLIFAPPRRPGWLRWPPWQGQNSRNSSG